MTLKPWQTQVLQDQLTEIGPSESNLDGTKFAYLEFRAAGRLHNVAVMADLVSKVNHSLGKTSCTFYLLHGENARTREAICTVIAVGQAGEAVYALNMERDASSAAAVTLTQKARTKWRIVQYVGLALAMIGLPLIMIFVGIPLTIAGICMWRVGKRVAAAFQYQVDFLELSHEVVSQIPDVRLL